MVVKGNILSCQLAIGIGLCVPDRISQLGIQIRRLLHKEENSIVSLGHFC